MTRILMLSWRSPGHPQSGGAEVLTHETLRRAVERGHQVTWFSAMWPGAAPQEEIDGIRVIRSGAQWSVHWAAWRWLRRRKHEFDIVVDQVNTIPFFTPLYVPPNQRRLYIFQTAREFWWRQTPRLFKPLAPIGYVAEPLYLKAYRKTAAVTISESTRTELTGIGIPRNSIDVIPMANTFRPLAELEPKTGPFRVVVVGRLEPAKHVEEAVRAFARLQRAAPDARLDIIGSGTPEYRDTLELLVASEGIRGVEFHGRVSEDRKHELLVQAHVHVFCSHREGWGLTVTEAAALGTPSLGYDVPGVRDSIGAPDQLAPRGDWRRLAEMLGALHDDPVRYEAIRHRAWEATLGLSYDATTDAFLEAVGA